MSDTGFHTQTFANRLGAMGDQAEQAFEDVWPTTWLRFGLNRPPIKVSSLPEFLRYTPDYMSGENMIEVQGIGREGVLKLKVEKYCALKSWDLIHPTLLFIFDSRRKKWGAFPIAELNTVLRNEGWTIGQFHDGPVFYQIPWRLLPCEWQAV